MANLIVAQLLYLDSASPTKDITMYVNSPGGSVTAGMAVFDTMRHIRPDVSTVCVGLAASMGAFLLASGAPGKRYALPNARIMIHQPLGGAQGQAADIEIQANEILHHKLTLNGYLAQFTGQGMDRITADTDRDFFMSSAEAVEYGLVDAVVTRPDVLADAPQTGRQAAAQRDAAALVAREVVYAERLAEVAATGADEETLREEAALLAAMPSMRVKEVEPPGEAPPTDPDAASQDVLAVPAARAEDMEEAADAVTALFASDEVIAAVTAANAVRGLEGGPTPLMVRAAASTAAYLAALGFPLTDMPEDDPHVDLVLEAVKAAAGRISKFAADAGLKAPDETAAAVPGAGGWEAKAVEWGVFKFCAGAEKAGLENALPWFVEAMQAEHAEELEAEAKAEAEAAAKAEAEAKKAEEDAKKAAVEKTEAGGEGEKKEGEAEAQKTEEERPEEGGEAKE